MDDFVARDNLLPETTLKVLAQRSDLRGLVHLTGHLAVLGITGWLVVMVLDSWWLAPAWLMHGLLLNFLFAPLHETIHRTAFKRGWINDVVAHVTGAVLVLPPGYFRHFHFSHHRYTQNPALDPELAQAKPDTLGRYLWSMSGLQSYWAAQISQLFRHACGQADEAFIPARARAAVIREARQFLAFYVGLIATSVWFDSWALVTLWLVPILLASPSLRLYLNAEHSGCELHQDMTRNTRTTRTNPLLRALAWNMPFHVEHHLFPGVPFHALPAVHKQIGNCHRYLSPGYLAHHRATVTALRASI